MPYSPEALLLIWGAGSGADSSVACRGRRGPPVTLGRTNILCQAVSGFDWAQCWLRPTHDAGNWVYATFESLRLRQYW